ncbi:fibrinogen [Arthrobacter sp. Z1-9]
MIINGLRSLSAKSCKLIAAALTAALLPVTLLSSLPQAAAAEQGIVRDGTTQLQAAASCWEIKQTAPAAPSGSYWLLTPQMPAPEQFYCDQETDGGGWVLIGRGREGWKEFYQGLGTPAQVRTTVTGAGAFAPRQLSSTVIDGLLNGTAPSLLQDGIRLRRATSADGANWQEARFKINKFARWVWTFSAEHQVASYTFGNGNFSGGFTSNFGTDQGLNRVVTTEAAAQNYTQGWSFGSATIGTTGSSSYLWSASASAGNARPFTQMYLRPKLMQADVTYPAVGDGGYPGYAQRALPQNGAQASVWGVTGLANGRGGELDTEVQDFAQIGNTVYVAGNFRYVQRDAQGLDRVEQSYLAGFNVDSGEWLGSFRPVLNGQVKALAVLPNGNLVAGGEFSTSNGAPAAGIVSLDPATGANDPAWRLQLENRLTGGVVQVRGLSVKNDWLYLGGAFTHLTGGAGANPVYARAGARVRVADGTPDASWNPAFNGTVAAVDAAANGQRLYAAGYFSASNTAAANRAAAVQTVAGAPLATPAWTWTPSSATSYQQAIKEVGDKIWLGGSQHSLFTFDPQTFARLSGNITKSGGDFQRIAEGNGVVYGSCHCSHWNYSNAFTFSNVGTQWTLADRINLIGAWDARTGSYIPDFNPVLRGRTGHGAWATLVDSRGKVWTGGDHVSAVNTNGAVQWAGGFAVFPPRDSTAPGTPTGLTVTSDNVSDTLTWSAGSGDTSMYHVIREDRVIATTSQTSVKVPALAAGRYAVRAADAAGNYSGSTAVVTAPKAVPTAELIKAGAEWKYRFATDAPDPAWKTTGFDDSTWNTGAAPLGWGSTGTVTTLTYAGATRPLSSHYRKSFTVDNPGAVTEVNIVTRADDGVVVYLNGTEVSRVNMPTGTITNNSYATVAPRTFTATANPVRITLPGSALAAGVNVISAEVHSNYRATPDSSFDLSATAVVTAP